MNRVGNFDVYRTGLYGSAGAAKEAEESKAAKAKETGSAEKSGKVTLSDEAKELLKELKKKYGNMDFIVADYGTDEEAERYLSRGTGEYSVLLTPDELEKMASDGEYKNQNLQVLDGALSELAKLKEQLGGREEEVSRIGIAIGENGELSYFAELEKVSEKQRERIEQKRGERREEADEQKASAKADETARRRADGGRERVRHTIVRADSTEELLKQIEQVDWNAVKAQEEPPVGRRFDFMV